MITSQWPTPEHPETVPFLVQHVEYLRQAGVEVEVFTFRGKKNPLNYLRAWGRLHRRYRLGAFDLIHAQFGQNGLLALPTSQPLVVTFHGTDVYGSVGVDGRYTWAGAILRQLSRFVAAHATRTVVVSEQLAQRLPSRARLHLIAGGIDLELFRPMPRAEARTQLGLPPDKPLVLFAADPARPVKRYDLAAQAVALLDPALDVELITLGRVSHQLVPVYMNACDALVLTSKHEGSPTVVKEALACNLPVVSVDVGDVRARIGSVEGCVVCANERPETVAEGLRQALQTRNRINGRAAVAELSEQATVQQMIEVYRAALADCGRQASPALLEGPYSV
jgi:glycosyltransferase involved in cell wall biosynthesis